MIFDKCLSAKILSAVLACFSTAVLGQSPKKVVRNTVSEPVYFIDSIQVDKTQLMRYDPTDIAAVGAYKDSTATKLIGEAGKYGIFYIETKPFARRRYQRYFTSKSPAYAALVQADTAEVAIQYILNGRPLLEKFEGTLAVIDDTVFQTLTVLDEATLRSKYKIDGKAHGIAIESRTPQDLYKGKKKF